MGTIEQKHIDAVKNGKFTAKTDYQKEEIQKYLPKHPEMCTPGVPEAIEKGETLTTVYWSEEEIDKYSLPREIRRRLVRRHVEGRKKDVVIIVTVENDVAVETRKYQEHLRDIEIAKAETGIKEILAEESDDNDTYDDIKEEMRYGWTEFLLDFARFIWGLKFEDYKLWQVCNYYANGFTREQIAKTMKTSERTVSEYRRTARAKWHEYYNTKPAQKEKEEKRDKPFIDFNKLRNMK